MPLVRFEVKNEYGLGNSVLYEEAEKDGPKALLESVAVAGLVGIIRQLGDLAEFAAEIFHGLHEQVTTTAERGQDIMIRIQQIEAEIPSLEKAALAQTTHIHLCYNPGSDWHAGVRTEENHLTRGDLPGFIIDAYEESRGPPRLFLLDKFDVAGAGACLKRYSDPSFFKIEWATSELLKAEKFKQERKLLRKKSRKRRSVEAVEVSFLSRIRTSEETLTDGTKSKSSSTSQLLSSSTKISYMEPFLGINVPSECMKAETDVLNAAVTSSECINAVASVVSDGRAKSDVENELLYVSSCGRKFPDSASSVLADNMELISAQVNSGFQVVKDESEATSAVTECFHELHTEQKTSVPSNVLQPTQLVDENKPPSSSGESQDNEVASELDSYADALNTMESEVDTDSESKIMEEMEFHPADKGPEVKLGKTRTELLPCTSNCSVVETANVPSEHFSQLDLEDYSVLESPVLNVLDSETCTSAIAETETAKEIVCNSLENNNFCPVILDEQLAGVNNHGPIPVKVCLVSSANLCPSDGLLVHESSESLDLIPADGCMTQGCPSHSIVVQSFTTDGPLDKKQKRKPGRVLNMPPEDVTCTDFLDMNPNMVCQERGTLVESCEFQQLAKQCEGPFKQNSRDLTKVETPTEFDNYNKENNREKVQEADISPRGHEFPALSKAGIPSDVLICEHGFLENGFQKEKMASEQLCHKSSVINNCENLSDEAGQAESSKNEEAGKVVQSTSADMDSISAFPEQTRPEPESPRNSSSSTSHLSDCSSPPLEHMKISFHPINNFESSTLNAEFPDEHNFDDESVRDNFNSSFQHFPEHMVPLSEIDEGGPTNELSFISSNWNARSLPVFEEPVTPKEVDSEVDSDASCKPSLNFSEDMLSQGSESNTDQWELCKLNEQKDNLCDSLHTISPSNSISSSMGMKKASDHLTDCPCETNDARTFNCSRSRKSSTAGLVDLSSSGHLIPEINLQEKESDPNQEWGSVSPRFAALPPIPPPPPQWGNRKSLGSAVQGQDSCQLVSTSQPIDVQTSEHLSTDRSKLSVPSLMRDSTDSHDSIIRKPKSLNRSAQIQQQNGRDMLLEQIRTKSFSLRRTVTTRPSLFMPRPTTNINVAAILEKANKIRQAFAGSDDESDDDGNWSDG
ncbi:unnamed protein product [Victoria cruziana]